MMQIGQTVTVIKADEHGQSVYEYKGEVIAFDGVEVCLKANFIRYDVDIGPIVFRRGDTMIEWFYTDRYYNIFQVEDVDDGRIKGWYCNITRPAQFEAATVRADDLALDVFVSPTGEITLLDEDEFAALDITPEERDRASQAVESLRHCVQQRDTPFHVIG